jgi:GNAT superfamily N-acetyltransferase
MHGIAEGVIIRVAEPGDLDRLVELCGEHALFERAPFDGRGLGARLADALFGPSRRLYCLVADDGGDLVGYASYSLEFSTWAGDEYVHMDTLYVRNGRRGTGIGSVLLTAVIDAAVAAGVSNLQWQTPSWNADAQRFYARVGAVGSDKVRYRVDCSSVDPSADAVEGSVPVTAARARHLLADLGEAWNSGDADRVAAIFRRDGVYAASVGPVPGATATGRAAVRDLAAMVRAHDSGALMDCEAPHVAGSAATVRWTCTAEGAEGAALVRGIDFFELAPDGVKLKDAYRKIHVDHDAAVSGLPARPTAVLDVMAFDGLRLRVIGITTSDQLPSRDLVAEAHRHLVPVLEPVGRGDGAGFAIIHTGLETTWLIVAIWHQDIAHVRTFRSPVGETSWEPVEAWGPTMCVWEMEVLDDERRAWIDRVLGRPETPDLDGYLFRDLDATLAAPVHDEEPVRT